MKISLNWLRRHIDYPGTVSELSEQLTGTGLEVEGVEDFFSIPGGLAGLVAGEVMTCTPIPDTQHLSATRVDVGNGTILPIVCGAQNVAAGQKVVVAVPGTTIHPLNGEPFTIGTRKLRGEESRGMICAEDEIGLGSDHSGIMVLPPETVPGTPVAELFGIERDSVLEIGLTANRGDAASHRGVARDLSALLDLDLKGVEEDFAEYGGASNWNISLEDPACPRYSGLLMENVSVQESPDWLKNRLKAIGLNPINNIVDITNFVLHDIGQPIHAFDADRISGEIIRVRKAEPGSVFVTLDGQERKMSGEELMICDAEKPLAMAGVFGGKHSGVSAGTRRIFIESAYFNPSSIRKTAKAHGLSTDASFRYERGTDPEITLRALRLVAHLVERLAGGRAASPIIDRYPEPIRPAKVRLDLDYLRQLLGTEVPARDTTRILKRLDIRIDASDAKGYDLVIPAFKSDVTRPADVVEEIIRIYGLDAIPLPERIHSTYSSARRPDPARLAGKMARHLVSRGFYETLSNSMTSARVYREEVLSGAVGIVNPLSADTGILRPGLLHSLLSSLAWNRNRRNADLKLFELGKVYRKKAEGGYFEETRLGMIVCGNWTGESWHSRTQAADLHLLKQEVEVLLQSLGMSCRASKWSLEPITRVEAQSAWISIGPVHSSILRQVEVQGEVWYAELNWDALMGSVKDSVRMEVKAAPRFPAVRRDLSVVIDAGTGFDTLNKLVQSVNKGLIREVNVFDVYEGEKLGEGKKSYSISFLLRDDEKTLNDQEIDALMNKLIHTFESQAGAIIRK